MAQRKLQQEMDKTFKKVAEGIVVFDGILEKIDNASNASQKDKLEDALKREIKKLQRQRDQIKTWAASNEIKDKKPLAEQRKNIEVCMEKFKAVEKEMKTKAFSKEGLSAPGKRDPKEQEKEDAGDFLAEMTASLESQLEALEAEEERLLASKKGKKDTKNADRLSEISRKTEQHKFHIGKLELFRRSLENGNIEPEQVQEKKEDIQYYVNDNASVDFMEMDAEDMYEGLNLQEEDGAYGVSNENDRVSSQDTQSVADESPEASDSRTTGTGKPKSTSVSEPQGTGARRPSNNLKSPLPALATLHTPMPSITNGATKDSMKPAPLPTRPPGETLKYASAAAAAAASDKAAVGIAPLPPPPGTTPAPTTTTTSSSTGPSGLSAVPQTQKSSTTSSPSVAPSLPASSGPTPLQSSVLPVATDPSTIERTAPSHASEKSNLTSLPKPSPAIAPSNESRNVSGSSIPQPSMLNGTKQTNSTPLDMSASPAPTDASVVQRTNGEGNRPHEAESVYHLPPGLQDLIQSFEITKSRAPAPDSPSVQRLLAASHATRPDYTDAEKPRHYRPDTTYASPLYYPQEPFHNADEPNLYNRIDTDTLFYIFYYRQNTYQQYLAAKALKSQSWRFHKQYQTWFQRHEEPKTITEEFEQGTYRFFDYESTWMNRRKADFKFAYKFLEDDL